MAAVLIAYASEHGHTAKIAQRIGHVIRGEGLESRVLEVGQAGDPSEYDGVIVGASLHAGRHQDAARDWVKSHSTSLGEHPSLFISVSLTAAEDTKEAREATQRCIDEFLDDTGWLPRKSVAVAGALQYREYDVFTRVLMRLMMRRGGHPTDTDQDVDYTDWDSVERLGRAFAQKSMRAAPKTRRSHQPS